MTTQAESLRVPAGSVAEPCQWDDVPSQQIFCRFWNRQVLIQVLFVYDDLDVFEKIEIFLRSSLDQKMMSKVL